MALFATIYPRDFSTGDTFAVKVTSSGNSAHTTRVGGPWCSAMKSQTSLKRDFFDGDFGSPVNAPSATIVLSMDVLTKFYATIARARWAGAKMTIEHWDGGSAQTLFTGVISGFTQQGRTVTLNAEIDTEPFDADVLAATYAGTTGIEGVADLEGVAKPFLLGRCYHAEPVLIDPIDNVYQFSAYGPIEAVTALFERGGAFGTSVGDYANYAALIAADIKEGQWGTCLAQGLIRLGAPAYGIITAHVDGDKPSTWIKRTGAIIKRLAANAGIDAGLIDTASLDAMDAAKPYDIGIYIKDQQSVLQVARRLCLPLNYQAGLDANGKLFALQVTTASPTLTLNGQGAMLPPVTELAEANASPPYKRIMMGYRKCWRVHTNDEIATEYNLVERGTWVGTNSYREGNIVSLADGSRWLYIATEAGEADVPGDEPLVWQALSGSPQNYIEPSTKTIVANADYLGSVPSESLPIGFVIRRWQGIDNVSASPTAWSIESLSPSGAAEVTVNASGGVSITAVNQSCTFIVRSVRDGITLDCAVTLTRQDAAAPNTGGGGSAGTTVNDSTFASFSGTTHTAVSDVMTVKTGSGGQIALTANFLSVSTSASTPIGMWNTALQWRHRPIGGSWTDLTESASTSPVSVSLDAEAGEYVTELGSVSSSPVVTGLTANTDYEVQLMARRTSGATKTLILSGNAVAAGS